MSVNEIETNTRQTEYGFRSNGQFKRWNALKQNEKSSIKSQMKNPVKVWSAECGEK